MATITLQEMRKRMDASIAIIDFLIKKVPEDEAYPYWIDLKRKTECLEALRKFKPDHKWGWMRIGGGFTRLYFESDQDAVRFRLMM